MLLGSGMHSCEKQSEEAVFCSTRPRSFCLCPAAIAGFVHPRHLVADSMEHPWVVVDFFPGPSLRGLLVEQTFQQPQQDSSIQDTWSLIPWSTHGWCLTSLRVIRFGGCLLSERFSKSRSSSSTCQYSRTSPSLFLCVVGVGRNELLELSEAKFGIVRQSPLIPRSTRGWFLTFSRMIRFGDR